jgi:hypothetical protein
VGLAGSYICTVTGIHRIEAEYDGANGQEAEFAVHETWYLIDFPAGYGTFVYSLTMNAGFRYKFRLLSTIPEENITLALNVNSPNWTYHTMTSRDAETCETGGCANTQFEPDNGCRSVPTRRPTSSPRMTIDNVFVEETWTNFWIGFGILAVAGIALLILLLWCLCRKPSEERAERILDGTYADKEIRFDELGLTLWEHANTGASQPPPDKIACYKT